MTMAESPSPSSIPTTPGVGWPVLVWLGTASAAEAVLAGWLWSGRASAGWILAGHGLVTSVAALTAWRVPVLRTDRTVWLGGITIAGAGPLGGLGALLSLAVAFCLRHQHHTIDEWYAQLFPRFAPDAHAAMWRRVGQRASDRKQPLDVIPFLDLLQHGTLPQKQSVISLISSTFTPAFAPALRAALTDAQNVIRVQAATAIARLENQFLEETWRLEAALKADAGSVEALTALARHYDDYAFTGLLDAGRERDCRDKALAFYERARALAPRDVAVATRLGRLHLRLGRYPEAEAALRVAAAATDEHEPRLWLMECYFRQRRYEDLRELARETREGGANLANWPVEVAPMLRLWMGEQELVEEAM